MANLKQLSFGDFIYISTFDGQIVNVSTQLDEKPSYEFESLWNQVDLRMSIYQVFPTNCTKLNEFYDGGKELVGFRKSPLEFEDAVQQILANFRSKEVKYGDEIRLFNPFSKGFLSIKNLAQDSVNKKDETSNGEKDNLAKAASKGIKQLK